LPEYDELENMSEEAQKEFKKRQKERVKGEEAQKVRTVYITLFAASIYAYLNFIAKTN
jgi:hypothetical protein